MQDEFFWLTVTKLLCTYITFAMDCLDFSLASLKKIVIHKNNSMRVPLNPSFNIPILTNQSGRSDKHLQPEEIKVDELAPSTCEQDKI